MSGLLRLLARHRRAVILTVALVLSFLLMTLQVRHEAAVVTFTRQVVLFSVSPFIKVTAALVQGTRNLWRDYVDLRHLREENKHLQRWLLNRQKHRERPQSLRRRRRNFKRFLRHRSLANWQGT